MPLTADELLNADQIKALLLSLGKELQLHGYTGEVYLVGGAAIALAYDGRRTTTDLDAVFEPKSVIYEAAERVAEKYELEPGWLNDAVKGLVPPNDPHSVIALEAPGITVSAASARNLLAMKVAASRVDRDQDDIRFLAGLLDLTTSEEILALVEEVWGPAASRLAPKCRFLVQEMFPSATH
ncbi:MAG: DUF6036 family nucleotidyltransferase [Promicromonosporaceae bacterium]|nr:DUF6036 family nucleotidyltransferase [Promicromonosporaceae bacterium]